MNVSFTYLSRIDGFSDVDPNAISSKYFIYMLVNTGDDGKRSIKEQCLNFDCPVAGWWAVEYSNCTSAEG